MDMKPETFDTRPATFDLRRFLLCAVLLLTIAAVGHAKPTVGESLLDSIQERYDSMNDYRAEFEQVTEYQTVNRTIRGKGEVYYKKPGRMLWVYEEPDGQFVLADGRHLYFYQPQENQVIKTLLGAAFRSDLPLSFLLGIGQIRTYFNAGVVEQIDNNYQVDLYPRKADAGFKKLQLTVSSENYDIKHAQIEDVGGNRWTIHFRNIEHDIGLKPSVFELKVPAGADIVEFGS